VTPPGFLPGFRPAVLLEKRASEALWSHHPIANVPRAIYQGRPLGAFLSSAAAIAAFTFLFGAALFPNLITSSEGAAYSLTVSRAVSSGKTLEIIQVVVALGMPFVLAYTATIYWVFRGKVKITPASY
jgi:cytochrome d ubiquinol oxidase subunit II